MMIHEELEAFATSNLEFITPFNYPFLQIFQTTRFYLNYRHDNLCYTILGLPLSATSMNIK